MMIRFFFLSLLLSIQISLAGQNQNYREIFGKRYEQAEEFIAQNRNLFEKYFPDSSEFKLAASIVFPEIIRFNELYDKIEVEALKTLYVQYGEQYANFSIGPFQMKPTFAEQLEKDYCLQLLKPDLKITFAFDTTSTKEARLKRVERLSTINGQLMYLSLFCEISEDRFHELKFDSSEERLRFLAAAYNSGFHNPIETILKREKEKHFHTEVVFRSKSTKYCYADISFFYFRELTRP
jgi:hypothetical protein